MKAILLAQIELPMLFIYLVNGGWTHWDDWTECSTSCGKGTRHRGRSCSNPLPDNGGLTCNGSDTAIGNCSLDTCPGTNWVLKSWKEKMVSTLNIHQWKPNDR